VTQRSYHVPIKGHIESGTEKENPVTARAKAYRAYHLDPTLLLSPTRGPRAASSLHGGLLGRQGAVNKIRKFFKSRLRGGRRLVLASNEEPGVAGAGEDGVLAVLARVEPS
jgi:hypothetical protein